MSILKNYKSSIILIICMVLGGFVGYLFPASSPYLDPVATTFLNLLYCIVVPMIFLSLVTAIARMTDLKKLAKILIWIMVITVLTGVISAIFTSIGVVMFDPTKGANLQMTETISDLTSSSNFLAMFTVNDFIKLFSRSNLMALIVFTLAFGIATTSLPEKYRVIILELFEALEKVIMSLVGYVMKLAPIGLFCLFATLIADQGSAIVGPLSRSVIIFYVLSIIYYFVSTTLYGQISAGAEGVKRLWKNIVAPSLTALGTCSSAATIPSNLVAAKNIGISDEIGDLAIPLGANLHKDGAVMIQILKIAFFCNVYGMNFLSLQNFILAITISVIASTVMGAIPAGGYVGEIFIVSAFRFPPESIPIMVMIGTITDAPATAINASSDVGMAMVIERIVNGKNWFKK